MLPKPRLTLLAAALLAANLAHTTPTASAPFTPEQQQLIRQISASEANGLLPQVASAAAANVQKTIEGEKQAIAVAKDALEVGRKSVDWWLSNISFWVGGLGLLIAVAGIGIPLWMGRKQKAEWQEKLADITQRLAEAQAAQQLAAAAQQQAEQHASEIETLRNNAQNKISRIPNAEQVTGALSAEVLAKLREEKPSQVVALIEQAWEAHEKEDWATAKPLWELLSLIESHDANVWFNLGYAEVHSEQNWQYAIACFHRSHLLQPDAVACNNWGNALSHLAETLTGETQQLRFAEAEQCYSKSIHMQPDYSDAYYNRGNNLSNWAKTFSDDAQQQCYAMAVKCYAKATRLQTDYAPAFNNWGIALRNWANTLTSDEQQQHLAEADQIYATASRLQPSDADIYHNWGIALEDWANTLDETKCEIILAKNEIVSKLATDSQNPYHLACLRAHQQSFDEARTLLEQARIAGALPNHVQLSSDKHLNSLRELDWFKALLAEVKQEEERQTQTA